VTERTCELCTGTFEQKSGRPARWCGPCRPQAARNNAKQWYRDNPDKVKRQLGRNPEYVQTYRSNRPKCTEKRCARPGVYKDGLCVTHHSRLMRTGSTDDPTARPARETVIGSGGYRMIRVAPGQYVGEHRLTVEAALGRLLADYENVHHKNGIRTDNRLGNLEVWVKPQPSGQRPEDLAEWVAEHYPELVRAALNGEPLTLF
jgi:hypothetical protein